jgi:hypothetical protein
VSNLLSNPSFETDTNSWSTFQAAITRITSTAKDGVAAAQVARSTGDNYSVVHPVNLSAVGLGGPSAGLTFTASAWVKGAGASLGQPVRVLCREAGGAQPFADSAEDIILNADWQRVTVTRTFVVDDRTNVYIYLWRPWGAVAGELFYLDAAEIVQDAVAAPAPSFLVGRHPAWKFVVCDPTGVRLGEPRGYARNLANIGPSKTQNASFRIRADDPLWSTIAAGDTMLKVYNSAEDLCFYGPIVTDEETAQGQGASVQVTAADLSWNLLTRFTGKDVTGVGVKHTAKDSGQIVFDDLQTINLEQATGVVPGTKETFTTRTVTYLWKRFMDELAELGAIAGSYEWELRYEDATPPRVYLDLKSSIGTDRSAELFLEYGTGKSNCAGYSRSRTVEKRATRVWALGTGTPTVSALAFDTVAEPFGRWEDVLNFGNITDAALLDGLAAAHVAIRKQARKTVNLTPFPKRAPRYGVDWFGGDLLTARVVINEQARVNGTARIWGAAVTIDELGGEAPVFQLVPD